MDQKNFMGLIRRKFLIEEFKMMRVIYSGMLGVVKIAVHLESNRAVVLKQIMKYEVLAKSKKEYVLRERSILKQIRSPYIVLLLGTFQDSEHLYLVQEFMQGGDLHNLLKIRKILNSDLAKSYAAQIVCSFSHLHMRGIIYRALKPENICIDNKGFLRLVDFGMAKRIRDGEKTFTMCGTPDYLAPEIILGKGHDENADWWTLGILIYEVLIGRPPFLARDPVALYEKILKNQVVFTKIIECSAESLISELLIKQPEERIKLKQIKKHEFFEGVNWRNIETQNFEPLFTPTITSVLDSSNFPFVEEIMESQPFMEDFDFFPDF